MKLAQSVWISQKQFFHEHGADEKGAMVLSGRLQKHLNVECLLSLESDTIHAFNPEAFRTASAASSYRSANSSWARRAPGTSARAAAAFSSPARRAKNS